MGHKLGEFAPTRTYQGHAADKKARRPMTRSGSSSVREARATARMVRGSGFKLNDAAKPLRGMSASKAVNYLRFSRKRLSGAVLKTLESAIANAENNNDMDVDSLIVSEAFVGKTLTMKRWRARARGRSARIEKPYSRLTIVVRESSESV